MLFKITSCSYSSYQVSESLLGCDRIFKTATGSLKLFEENSTLRGVGRGSLLPNRPPPTKYSLIQEGREISCDNRFVVWNLLVKI